MRMGRKKGVAGSELQGFIDGTDGVNWGLVALNDNTMKLDLALTDGQVPCDGRY